MGWFEWLSNDNVRPKKVKEALKNDPGFTECTCTFAFGRWWFDPKCPSIDKDTL
jgi:hypothetical protein